MLRTFHTRLLQGIFLSLILSFALGLNYLYAWTGPLSTPAPACVTGDPGCDAPLNVGPYNQAKLGNLYVGDPDNLATDRGLVSYGRVRSALGGIEFPDGTVQTTAAGGAQGLSFSKYMHVQDQKPSGTHGGSYTSGVYRIRALNTPVTNNIAGASLNTTTNTITLPAGSFFIDASAPGMIGLMKAKLQNISGGTTALLGTAEFADGSSNDGSSRSYISGVITINSSQDFQVMMRGTQNVANVGFGSASSFGDNEIYTDVKIWKLD